jgi:hypothetical protein
MNLKDSRNQKGFIALISVIIIFAILLMLTALIATSTFFTRFNVLDYENKKVSANLAEACAQIAMVNLAKDPGGYPGSLPVAGQQITIATGKTCRICAITSGPFIITTRAVYNKAYTNLKVVGTLNSSNFNVTSWDEFTPYSDSCAVP